MLSTYQNPALHDVDFETQDNFHTGSVEMSFDISSPLRNQDKNLPIYLDFYKEIEHKLYKCKCFFCTFALFCTEAFLLNNTMMSLSWQKKKSDVCINDELQA